MTTQIHTLDRPGLARHAGNAPDPPARIILHNRDRSRSLVMNGACKTEDWLPLFDQYGVDLVVAGHEHHFERTFPVRGILPGSTLLTPAPQGTDPYLMDTSTGTVHMIIGGGGHSTPTPVSDFDMPHDGVLITSVGPGSPQAQHPTITTTEPAPWSAYRDLQTPTGSPRSTSCRTNPAE
jgi:hypothetical protein